MVGDVPGIVPHAPDECGAATRQPRQADGARTLDHGIGDIELGIGHQAGQHRGRNGEDGRRQNRQRVGHDQHDGAGEGGEPDADDHHPGGDQKRLAGVTGFATSECHARARSGEADGHERDQPGDNQQGSEGNRASSGGSGNQYGGGATDERGEG